jgi:hypothetical protein
MKQYREEKKKKSNVKSSNKIGKKFISMFLIFIFQKNGLVT